MKSLKRYLILCSVMLSMLSMLASESFAQSAIYAGGPVYRERTYSIDELRNSGFTTVIVWTIHIESNGDLGFNGEFPLVQNGEYVGGQHYPNFPADIALLKTQPTSISRIEFGLSAAGSGTYASIRDLIEAEGTGPNSTLYQNFQALKQAIPGIDAFNNDDESTYHVASSVAFSVMLADMGYKTALVPYTNSGYWSAVTQQVNAQRPGAVDALYLQAYAGGSGNNPCFGWDFGIPVYPGLWGGAGHNSPSTVESRMQSWKDSCAITGGFMWLYDDFDNSNQVAEYAGVINRVFDVDTGLPPEASSNPGPADKITGVSLNAQLTWSSGTGTESHHVYFGTNPNVGTGEFQGAQTENNFDPGPLTVDTTYYWKVDEVNANGATAGDIWRFTTGSEAVIDHTDPPGQGIVSARAQIHSEESADRAFDNLSIPGSQNRSWSKWLDNDGIPTMSNPSWIQIELPQTVTVNRLVLVSGNDFDERDPHSFNLQASNDGVNWTTLSSWSGEVFTDRFQRQEFSFLNDAVFRFYRLNITANKGDVSLTQITEIELLGPDS